jgi:hypothetical protein
MPNPNPLAFNPLFLAAKICVVLLSFWLALFLAWHTLSSVHFFYPFLYDTLEFGSVIQQYAPLNIHKSGFEQTERAQHIALFGEIVSAINRGGQGLAEMVYYNAQGQVIDTFLHPAEVIHLQDVANLLEVLTRATYWVMGGLFFLLLFFKVKQQPLHHLPKALAWTLATLIVLSTLVIAWDAQAIFYALHTLIFPAEHQWFFYYQESLMTTLMKAPDIFAAIAVLLLVVAFGYCAIILWLISRALKQEKI